MTRALRCSSRSSRSSALTLNLNRIEAIAAFVAIQMAVMLLGLPARAADEIQCGVLAPVVGRACAVTAGTDGQTLLRGDVLGDGQIYRGGAVLVDAVGNISCSGCGCSAPDATVIRCPETVISPGLINSYDHITFDQNAPALDTGERYEQRHDWRADKRGHTGINVPGGATANQIRWAELRQLIAGTTSVSSSGGTSGLIRNLDSLVNQGLGIAAHRRDTFPLGDSNGTQISAGCGYPNITTTASIDAFPAYLPVVGEGIDVVAQNEFVCTSSALGGGQDLAQPRSAFGKGLAYQTADF